MSVVPFDELIAVMEDQAEQKAQFCLRTGIAPSEYDNLTQIEIEAFVKEYNRQARRNSK